MVTGREFRLAVRSLLQNPGYSCAVLFLICIVIGVSTSVFSVLNATALRPLPVRNPDDLALLVQSSPTGTNPLFPYPDYLYYRDHSRSFSGLMAFSSIEVGSKEGGSAGENVKVQFASYNYFEVLGLALPSGRVFTAEEENQPNTTSVTVISHDFWRRRFASAPDVLGKTIELNGHSVTVIGVASPDFKGTDVGFVPDLWVPIAVLPEVMSSENLLLGEFSKGAHWLMLMGRLKPKTTIQQAQAEITLLDQQINESGQIRSQNRILLPPGGRGNSSRVGALTHLMIALSVVLAAIFLVVGANLATMAYARMLQHRKEIAIRAALGSPRSRLIWSMLAEPIMLSLLGGACGLVLAQWMSRLLPLFAWGGSADLDVRLDVRVFVFAVGFTFLFGVSPALVPAFQLSQLEVVPILNSEATSSAGSHTSSRARKLLVVAQVSLCLALLAPGIYVIKTVSKLEGSSFGFDPNNVVYASVWPSQRLVSPTLGRDFYRQLFERVRSLPGVTTVTAAQNIPLRGAFGMRSIEIEGYQRRADEKLMVFYNIVGPDYFHTLDSPLVAGRDFTDQDNDAAPRVAIVNEAMARRFWPGSSAIGKRINGFGRLGYEVIGVARDSDASGNGRWDATACMYLPFQQSYPGRGGLALLVRAQGSQIGLPSLIRGLVSSLDSEAQVGSVGTLNDLMKNGLQSLEVVARLLTLLGSFVIILAASGVYALVAYLVTLKRREIGIRLALGAAPHDLLRQFCMQSVKHAFMGVCIGALPAVALNLLLTPLLYFLRRSPVLALVGISPSSALTPTPMISSLFQGPRAGGLMMIAGIAALLVVVALAASYLPAHRASRVDPLEALRYE